MNLDIFSIFFSGIATLVSILSAHVTLSDYIYKHKPKITVRSYCDQKEYVYIQIKNSGDCDIEIRRITFGDSFCSTLPKGNQFREEHSFSNLLLSPGEEHIIPLCLKSYKIIDSLYTKILPYSYRIAKLGDKREIKENGVIDFNVSSTLLVKIKDEDSLARIANSLETIERVSRKEIK